MSEVRVLLNGRVFGEQPRWHQDRLWFSDWGTQEVIAVDLQGNSEVMLRGESFPLCVDWLPDGRLLVVSARDGLLLRREQDGSLVTHADLKAASDPPAVNELVVDARGNAYVNGGGFDLMAGEPFAPGIVALVTPDGSARAVADGLAFPNGMLIMPDDRRWSSPSPTPSGSPRSTLTPTAASRTGACGPISATASRTASAPTPRTPSGTRTSRTSGACAFAKAARSCRRSSLTAAALRAPSADRRSDPVHGRKRMARPGQHAPGARHTGADDSGARAPCWPALASNPKPLPPEGG